MIKEGQIVLFKFPLVDKPKVQLHHLSRRATTASTAPSASFPRKEGRKASRRQRIDEVMLRKAFSKH
jgi:hypothetical protein